MARRLLLPALSLLAATACGKSDDQGADAGTGPVDAAVPVWFVEPDVPTTEDLFAVWGRGLDEIYAVGWNATILRYDGTRWVKETTTATVPLSDIHGRPRPMDPMRPPSPIFAVGWGGTILQRGADGTWADAAPSSTVTADLFGVWMGSERSALAVGDQGRMMGWDGRAWTQVHLRVPGGFSGQLIEPLGTLKSTWSNDGMRYYISGSGGATYRSNGGLMGFESLDTLFNQQLRGIWGPPGGGLVLTVGLDSLVLRFQGGQWQRIRGEIEELPITFLMDLDGLDTDGVTIVGWRGVVLRFVDGHWISEATPTQNDLRGVWIDPETQTAFAVGASGLILRRPPPPPVDAGM